MRLKKSIVILSVCVLLVWFSAAQAGYIDNGDGTVTDTGTGLMGRNQGHILNIKYCYI